MRRGSWDESMISDPLKRPLVFGDLEQINAIKRAEAQADFDKIKVCEECSFGKCPHCRQECPQCDGSGKERTSYEEFKRAYPHFHNL